MASRQSASPLDTAAASPLNDVALRWSNLADRRLAYYISLYESGRWRHYFDERQFLARIRDVKRAATEWDRIASKTTLTDRLAG
ncbi:MAG: TIGR03809 family protein [Xanthobacteraceae bacterium]|uniref:TIGR03809 family protein n=1 Tax=Pseudolabrys sp. TaxID=1960880 RepID=UPI003D1319F6